MADFRTKGKGKSRTVYPVEEGGKSYRRDYSDEDRQDIDDMSQDIHGKDFDELTVAQQKGALEEFNERENDEVEETYADWKRKDVLDDRREYDKEDLQSSNPNMSDRQINMLYEKLHRSN